MNPLEIDCAAVKSRLAAGAPFLLLDCREPDEHQFVRIEPAALIPMSELPERVGELEPYKEKEIVVYCHHGVRSLHVARWLRDQGYPNVVSMTGGIDAWSATIDPSLPRY